MIADILMYISIICVFASLIPASISDYKTRTIEPKVWKSAAFIGVPLGIISFCMKLIYNEIVIPSLILSISSVLIVIIITMVLATRRDPLYNPKFCEQCGSPINKTEIIKCPRCQHNSGKSILGGADMIAIDIILLTSFYISWIFVPTFIFSFMISCGITILYLGITSKNFVNYRIPLIIPITIAYAITLTLSILNIDILASILP